MFRIPKEVPDRWKAARQLTKDDPKTKNFLMVNERNREEHLAIKAWLDSWDAPEEVRRAFSNRVKGRCMTPSTITMLSYAQWTSIGISMGLDAANRKKVWLQIPSLRIDTGMAEESKVDFGAAGVSGSPRESVASPASKKGSDIAVVETMPSEALSSFFKKYKFSKIMIAKLLTEKRSLTGRLLSSLNVSMFDYMGNDDINDLADEKGLNVIERLTLKFAIHDYRREQRVRIRKRQIGWDVYRGDDEFYDEERVNRRSSRDNSSVFFHTDRTDNAFAHLNASVKLWKQHIQRRMAEVNAKIGVCEEMTNFGLLGEGPVDDTPIPGGDTPVRDSRKLRAEMPLSLVITKMRKAHAKHFSKNQGEDSIYTWQELWIKEWNRTENGETIPAIWRNSPLDEDGREMDSDVGSVSSVSGPTLMGSYDTTDCTYEDFVVSMMGSGFERKEQIDYRQLRHEELMAKTKTMHLRKILPLNLASGAQKRTKVPTLTRTKTFQTVPPLSALLFDAASSHAAAASVGAGKIPLTVDTDASAMDEDSPMITKSAGGSKTISHTRAMTALPEGKSSDGKRDSIRSVGSLNSGLSRTMSHTNVLAGLTTPKSGLMTPSNAAASFMFAGGSSTGPSGISAMSQFKSRRMAKQRAKMMEAERKQRDRDMRGGRRHKRSVTFSALSPDDRKKDTADSEEEEEDSYSDEDLDEDTQAKIKSGVSHASTPKSSKSRSSGLSLKAMASEAIALESRDSITDQLSPGHKVRQIRRVKWSNDLMKEQYEIDMYQGKYQATMHEVLDTDVFHSRSVSPIMCEPGIKSDQLLTCKLDVKNPLICIGVIESSALRMGLLISDIVERTSTLLSKTVWVRNHAWWQCKKKDMKGISQSKLRRYYKHGKWFGERENEDKMLDRIDAGVPIPLSKRWSQKSRVVNDDEEGDKKPDGTGVFDEEQWEDWEPLTLTITVNMTSAIGLFKKRNPKRRGSETDVSDCESSSSSDVDEFEDESSYGSIDTDSDYEESEEEEVPKKSRLTKRRMTIQCDGCPTVAVSIPYTWQKVSLFVCPDDPAGYLGCPLRLYK